MSAGNPIKVENKSRSAAALAITESILLCLGDRKILREHEIIGILEDALAAHRNAAANDGAAEIHHKVAALIQSIIDSGNSVRHPT